MFLLVKSLQIIYLKKIKIDNEKIFLQGIMHGRKNEILFLDY